MRVVVELFAQRATQEVDLADGATGLDLLGKLGLAPDAHLLIRGDAPIPLDDLLADGERLRILAVVSGGR